MGNSAISSQETAPDVTLERPKEEHQNLYPHIEKKIGIAVIGCGQRLRALLRLFLPKHGELVKLIAICDEAQDAIIETRSDLVLGPFCHDVPTFNDYTQVLKLEEVEWVLIGSKNYLHKDHCISSFKAGKNVFCEKPLAITIDQCVEIRKVQQETGKLFATGFVLRHSPFYKKIHEIVSSNEIGKIISIEANELLSPGHGGYIMRNWRRFRNEAGPHLLEKCCHDLDIINWMIGSVPSHVASFGDLSCFRPENKPKDEMDQELYNTWPAWEDVNPFDSEKDIEDNQVVIMQYRNNVKVSFHTNSNTALPQRRILICGLTGTIEGNLITGKIVLQKILRKDKESSKFNNYEEFNFGAKGMHGGGDEIIMDDLARSIEKGTIPAATGEEGFLSAVVCLACDEARRTSQVVDLEPIWRTLEV